MQKYTGLGTMTVNDALLAVISSESLLKNNHDSGGANSCTDLDDQRSNLTDELDEES